MSKPEATEALREFVVAIEWHTNQRTAECSVIARTPEDACQIARRLFSEAHTKECVIDQAEVKAVQ